MTNKQKISQFHRNLKAWYLKNGRRELPWRTTADPYAIYLSEIMLQQTQVKTVEQRFYRPFLEIFPTLESLAKAPPQKLMKAWQGLGYYNRAANLQKAARQCGGKLPSSYEELLALPGIGRNTAHAICAFGFQQPKAVMEANVKRVICRIYALKTPNDAQLWELADGLLDRKNPFDYNQAMMDIGAMVCTKRKPDCDACPASGICSGKAQPELYPTPKPKKAVPVRKKTIVVLVNTEGKYFATPRKTRFLGGMYHFVEQEAGTQRIDFLDTSYALAKMKKAGRITQQYSHFTLEADIYLHKIVCAGGRNWYSKSQLQKLPMSGAEQKILALL